MANDILGDNDFVDKAKETHRKNLLRKSKRTKKNIRNWESQLSEANQWMSLHQQAELAKASYHLLGRGKSSIKLYDWQKEEEIEIALNPALTAQEQLQRLFRTAKKLKSSIPNLNRMLEKGSKLLSSWTTALAELNSIQTKEELNAWEKLWVAVQKDKKAVPQKKKVSYKLFKSASGLHILVGKNARDNDELTFKVAHGSDYWLHVADYGGSHVVIKVIKGREPDNEAILDACQLALHYSKAKDQREANVHLTQCKYVQKIKKSPPGMVSLSKHRSIRIIGDMNRLKSIFERS